MSAELIARIRRARESRVEVDGFTVTVRRPTDAEMAEFGRLDASSFDIIAEAVVGWEGVTENDIAGGGGTDAVPFTRALWREVAADHRPWWDPIAKAVMESYEEHQRALADAAKK